ncbi:MAG TPA: PfkB family carbohydrate kinase, partial [Arenicellales bacterium]|nr:PfkB family carbohydrate kinase [Arenicellales bacterium]
MTIKLPDFFRVKLLVVGDVMLDRYWFGKVNRISPEAPVPVVAVNRSEERAGGAANVAANVVAMGARCELLSVVGDDEGGETLGRLLDQLGVDNHLHIDDKMKTTVKVRIVSQNQQLLRSDFESLPGHDVLARCFDDFANELPNVECVILSDYGKGGLPRIQEMIDLGVSVGVPVMVDPKGVDFSRYKRATMVTPNLAEFEAVVGKCADEQQMEERAVALIRDLELSGLLVTMGSQGARLFSPEEEMVK